MARGHSAPPAADNYTTPRVIPPPGRHVPAPRRTLPSGPSLSRTPRRRRVILTIAPLELETIVVQELRTEDREGVRILDVLVTIGMESIIVAVVDHFNPVLPAPRISYHGADLFKLKWKRADEYSWSQMMSELRYMIFVLFDLWCRSGRRAEALSPSHTPGDCGVLRATVSRRCSATEEGGCL